MKCPNCLASKIYPVDKIEGPLRPPVRWIAEHVRCETCLTHFYRLRGVGLLIRRGISFCCPF